MSRFPLRRVQRNTSLGMQHTAEDWACTPNISEQATHVLAHFIKPFCRRGGTNDCGQDWVQNASAKWSLTLQRKRRSDEAETDLY